jgi:hypothetical protein
METPRGNQSISRFALVSIPALLALALEACGGVAPDSASEDSGADRETAQVESTLTTQCVPRARVEKPPFELLPQLAGDQQPISYKPIAARPLCPSGQVPLVRARRPVVPKLNPLVAADRIIGVDPDLELIGSPAVKAILPLKRLLDPQWNGKLPPDPAGGCDGVDHSGTCYYYGNAAFSRTADGGGMITDVERPAYAGAGGSGHSLNEIAVQGGPGNGNILEVGWNVSTDQYGDAHPHLFVFHWRDWVPTCYDGCGWQQYSSTYYPGQDLNSIVGREVYIGFVQYEGNWWAWFDNQWMGYFPGSEWPAGYTQNTLIQWFGEVATHNGVPPITDMGDGQFPSGPSPAAMRALCDVDAAAWVCWYRDRQTLSATVPEFYDIAHTGFGSVAYGGDGGG